MVTFYSVSGDVFPNVKQATKGSNAYDLCANLPNPIEVPPLGRAMVPTDVAVDLDGHYGLVLPRSGMAAKYGITVLNSPGLIDSDYQGEIVVILYNSNPSKSIVIEPGDRVAQLLIQRPASFSVTIEDGPAYSEWRNSVQTERGDGGFGSTGA
jgi:dUTP pyrophosphatase